MATGPLKRVASTDKDISPPPAKRKPTPTAAATSRTTNKAVSNFFKPASQKEPEKCTFNTLHDSLLIARYSDPASTATAAQKPLKIAIFDFDSTLITTKSGLKFPRDADDWKWWHASVPARLNELHGEGFAIVIVSNQGAVSLKSDSKTAKADMKSLSNFKTKVAKVLGVLDLPVSVYAAMEKDLFRKPRKGMWDQLLKDYSLEVQDVDPERSVFVGDAAGRAEDKTRGRKKDHSSSDRDFASNIGIPFQTPEEFFLKEDATPFTRTFEPSTYLDTEVDSQTDATPILFTKRNDGHDLILFCGSPGAGKSTFFWRHLQPLGYERVNQDLLKTRDNCMKVVKQVLESAEGKGKGVVVDNTNADIETRAAWVKLARSLGVEVRMVHFTAGVKVCEHNDTVRALTGEEVSEPNGVFLSCPEWKPKSSEHGDSCFDDEALTGQTRQNNPEKRAMLPKMAFSGFASRYREPKLEEGFQDITKVDFKVNLGSG